MNKYEQLKLLDEKIKEKRARNDLEGIQKDSIELRTLAHQDNNHLYEAFSYYYSAFYHYMKKENSLAIRDSLAGIALCNTEQCIEAYMLLSNISGVINSDQDNLLTGLEHFLNAYYKSIEHPEIHLHHLILNNLGTLFIKVEDFQNALKCLIAGYKERRKQRIPMDQADAILITNIAIAYAQLEQYDNIPFWLKTFQAHKEEMQIPLPYLNHLLTLIYMDYHTDDDILLQKHVEEALELTYQERDANNLFQLLSFIFHICIKKKNRKLCDKIYEKMKNTVCQINSPLMYARLSNDYIHLLSEFDDAMLKEALIENYHLNLQARQEEQKREQQSLKLKMELMENQYQQKKIIEQNEKLLYTSELDLFTGIYHKKAFQEHAAELIKKVNADTWGALLILDIDHFKQVNDTYGHFIGDKAILCIVDRMKQVLHNNDIIGRIGGDEFSIFFCSVQDEIQVQKNMDAILEHIHSIQISDFNITFTVSIGCYLIKDAACEFNNAFQNCDKALYQAKKQGRNKACFYNES